MHWSVVQQWARPYGLQVWAEGNFKRIIERMEASPEKHFFRADVALDETDDSFFVAGEVRQKKVWVYAAKAISQREMNELRQTPGKFTLGLFKPGSSLAQQPMHTEMFVWCMEIQTAPIQHQVTVTRKKVQEGDVLTTESRDFEKTFDISGTQESDVLQLLDPAMMDLLLQSPADALEFSDQSVILYRFNRDISAELLEQTLQSGLAIAQQVDRNYPKAKHAERSV